LTVKSSLSSVYLKKKIEGMRIYT